MTISAPSVARHARPVCQWKGLGTMDKEAALFAIRGTIRTLRELQIPETSNDPKTRVQNETLLGVRDLCEAFAMALADSTKAHAPLAFDRAHKRLFDVTQQSSRPGYGDYVWIAAGCMALASAMKWLFLSKPTS